MSSSTRHPLVLAALAACPAIAPLAMRAQELSVGSRAETVLFLAGSSFSSIRGAAPVVGSRPAELWPEMLGGAKEDADGASRID